MKKRIAVVTALAAAGVVALGGTSIAMASSWPDLDELALTPAALSSTPFDDQLNDSDDDHRGGDHTVDQTGTHSDDHDNDDTADEHGDEIVVEADFAAASAAALTATGGGTVTDVESSDDGDHVWEVDVTLDSGAEVEVELDASFTVVHVDND